MQSAISTRVGVVHTGNENRIRRTLKAADASRVKGSGIARFATIGFGVQWRRNLKPAARNHLSGVAGFDPSLPLD